MNRSSSFGLLVLSTLLPLLTEAAPTATTFATAVGRKDCPIIATAGTENIFTRPWGLVASGPSSPKRSCRSRTPTTWTDIPRGGADGVAASSSSSSSSVVGRAAGNLCRSLRGGKADALLLLAVTALVPGACHRLRQSPILGFLASGVALGPQGLDWVSDVHRTELLADLGVVLFLFEMGVHLSLDTLWEMRSIVFGLGGLQMALTGTLVAAVAAACGMSPAACFVVGGGLALSSSAFVLQLLKDKSELETSKGKHSFGVLLLQDLAVVPLLVVTPLLAGGGEGGAAAAVVGAIVQALMAVGAIALFGRYGLRPLFETVLSSPSENLLQEATVAVSLATILGMSFLTEGLGLSNTLGAFLAGVLVSEAPFRKDVEAAVSPVRGILVGLFFFSVGFEIDLPLLFSWQVGKVAAIVAGLMACKTAIITVLCRWFATLDIGTSRQIGCILSQGGEFAFVAFRLARSLGILDAGTTKLLLTAVSLTMALTPLVDELGSNLAAKKIPDTPPRPPVTTQPPPTSAQPVAPPMSAQVVAPPVVEAPGKPAVTATATVGQKAAGKSAVSGNKKPKLE